MSKTEMPMSAGRQIIGEGISMVPKLYDFEGDIRFRPVMPDGRGIRVTPDGLFYDTIRESDTYGQGSTNCIIRDSDTNELRSINGCPIYFAEGKTPADILAIEEYRAYSGILVAECKCLRHKLTEAREGVTKRLARLPKDAGVEEFARRCRKNAELLKNEAQICRKGAKKAKRRHASAEEIEKLRETARFHIKAVKEFHNALRLIQLIVIDVAKARNNEAEATSLRTNARDISHREARRAKHAATQAHITVTELLTAAATQMRGAAAPPPASSKIFFFQTTSGAVA